jgi:hypothetical protein
MPSRNRQSESNSLAGRFIVLPDQTCVSSSHTSSRHLEMKCRLVNFFRSRWKKLRGLQWFSEMIFNEFTFHYHPESFHSYVVQFRNHFEKSP